MASRSSKPKSKFRRIKIDSPHCRDLVFDNTRLPSSFWEIRAGPTIFPGPGGPEDLPEVFDKVVYSSEGFFKSLVRMYDNLITDGYADLGKEIMTQVTEQGRIPVIMLVTGIIEEYADAGKTIEAMVVYLTLLASNCAPNPYTYSVIIKALAADPDPKFLEVANLCLMEMMGKGMQPNASTYTAVFEAFAGQEKMEEAKQFLEEMKANGFVADKKAMRAIRHVLKGKGPVVKTIIDILFDDSEDYSDESEDDDAIKKYADIDRWNWSRFPPESYVPLCKKQVIEDDPENPKDLEQVFDAMCRNGPLVLTLSRMINMLLNDGFICLANEISAEINNEGNIPEVVTHTGVIEFYAKKDKVKEAFKVFLHMISLGVAPNAYTYSVIIKTLTKDSNFLEDAKKYLLEMMDKGMQPNARTYISVFKAFARLEEDNVEKGKEFLMEMKAKGFMANKKAVMEVIKGRKGPVVQTVISILFGK